MWTIIVGYKGKISGQFLFILLNFRKIVVCKPTKF